MEICNATKSRKPGNEELLVLISSFVMQLLDPVVNLLFRHKGCMMPLITIPIKFLEQYPNHL